MNRKLLETSNVNAASSTQPQSNLQPIELHNLESNGVRNVVAGLLELQLTDNLEVINTNTPSNMSTTSKEDYHDDHDFSVVEKQHIHDSSSDSSDESLYDPEDDTTSDS